MQKRSSIFRCFLNSLFTRTFVCPCAVLGAVLVVFAGCAAAPSSGTPTKVVPDIQTLNPGDVIKVAFPANQNLDSTQQIRRDGRINLNMIGEVKAADKTPIELEKELEKAYSSLLTSKEIKVTVLSSSFAVYVTGAVMKPGKITPERALTAFDAIMEAGGFDTAKANTKKVRVIRQEDGQVKSYPLDMKAVMNGAQSEPFYLKSHDVVVVPEKISWF
jgi:polysaccharide biosynthesis/export protein